MPDSRIPLGTLSLEHFGYAKLSVSLSQVAEVPLRDFLGLLGQSLWVARIVRLAFVTFIIALLLAPLFALTSCFAAEVLFGLRPLPDPKMTDATGRAVIIVPAHDEASILGSRLPNLREAAEDLADILVVADNCTDATAKIAKQIGVEVIERFDTDRRGKSFALSFARDYLSREPPALVLIVDADCMIDDRSLKVLIQSCAATGKPCQATNLQKPAPEASPTVQLSTFSFFIKNVVRQRGLQRLSGRSNLFGTGMALPWPIFARADLSTSSIVEDLKLGQELAEAGHAPLFVERATVWSLAETRKNTLSQRSRWEGGFLQNAVRVGPSMLRKSLKKLDGRGICAALDAMIPPFALLILLDLLAATIASLVAWITSANFWPPLVLFASQIASLAALALAWRSGGTRFVSLDTLWRAPLYVLWKLPMYVGFARGGTPKEWLRTRRD